MKKIHVLFLIFLMIMLTSCSVQNESEVTKDYGCIGGEPITQEEVDYFRMRDRAEVVNDFAEKYGISDFSDFWETEYDGITPAEYLEKTAIEDAKDAKIRLIIMKEKGIYDTCSFADFKASAEKYNKEHAEDKPTVGINTINLDSFYTYYISTGEIELKNILAENELKPSEDEIKSEMEKNDNLTEQGAVSAIVDEKYEAFIKEYAETIK